MRMNPAAARSIFETESKRLTRVREEFAPELVAEIETRTAEVKGDLLADVADEIEINTAIDSASPT